MATSCKFEFQVKHLKLDSVEESQFYEFQWTKKKLPFVIYRAFILLYHWGWMIAGWVLVMPDHWYTVSNWSLFFTGLYFLSAFITALYGILKRKNYTAPEPNGTEPSGVNQVVNGKDQGKLRFFHKITWLLHLNATILVLYVTILYWVLVAPGQPEYKLRLPIGQHKHSVQGFLMLLDFFLVAIPTRWLHFLYALPVPCGFGVFTVIVHVVGINSAIYGVLDYENNLSLAIGVLIISMFAVPIILHTVWFALFHLRAFIFRQTVGKRAQNDTAKAKFDAAHDNVAFTP